MKFLGKAGLQNDRGVALVFVLWVIVVLGVIAGQFCYSMKNEVMAARYIKDETAAYYIAYAGMSRALQTLSEKNSDGKNKWRTNIDLPEVPFSDGGYQIKLENESGKINLNYADRELIEILVKEFALEKDGADVIIDSILDWRDKDSLHRLHGAENDYYQALPKPYKCRDGYFRTVDELLLIRGVTEAMFNDGLKDLVSVAILDKPDKKKARNAKTDLRGKININAAGPGLLAILPGMTPKAINKILLYRQEKDITGMGVLAGLTGSDIAARIRGYLCYENNNIYTVTSKGWTKERLAPQKIRAMVQIESESVSKNSYRIVQWLDSVFLY